MLELRLAASDSHAEDVAFWREAQQEPSAALAVAEAGDAAEAVDGEGDAPSPRRRRRRRRS